MTGQSAIHALFPVGQPVRFRSRAPGDRGSKLKGQVAGYSGWGVIACVFPATAEFGWIGRGKTIVEPQRLTRLPSKRPLPDMRIVRRDGQRNARST